MLVFYCIFTSVKVCSGINDCFFVELTAPVPATSTTTATTTTGPRIIHNSFDIINPLVIDEGGEQKRKQPPMAFRSGTREVHNKLEKHRRAHLKECFDVLKRQLPGTVDEKKSSNLSILHSAFCHIQSLKRRERELEHEMERLAREKIAYQQRLAVLKKEVAAQCDGIDFSALLPDVTAVSQPNHETSVISEGTQETRTTESPNTTTGDQRVLRTTSTLQRPVVPVAVNGIKEVSLRVRPFMPSNTLIGFLFLSEQPDANGRSVCTTCRLPNEPGFGSTKSRSRT